jgi:imidazolonepropionase-like amidohydrolase
MWIAGRPWSLRIEDGKVVARGEPRGELLLVPAFLDAHVHLAVAGKVQEELLRSGIAAVLDLGAPLSAMPFGGSRLQVVFAGPMLTAPRGYPTQSWGANGFGAELASASDAREAVARVAALGARFVKLAFDPRYPLLEVDTARAAADEAHRRGLLVAAHALEAESVRRALEAGCDVLAHTPREELPSQLLKRLRGKWVISTLRAFGVAPERLRALQNAGMRVAYGTDLGNEGTSPSIEQRELELLAQAGVDPLRAATSAAAELLGLADLGALREGAQASLLAVRDLGPQALAHPEQVYDRGTLLQ